MKIILNKTILRLMRPLVRDDAFRECIHGVGVEVTPEGYKYIATDGRLIVGIRRGFNDIYCLKDSLLALKPSAGEKFEQPQEPFKFRIPLRAIPSLLSHAQPFNRKGDFLADYPTPNTVRLAVKNKADVLVEFACPNDFCGWRIALTCPPQDKLTGIGTDNVTYDSSLVAKIMTAHTLWARSFASYCPGLIMDTKRHELTARLFASSRTSPDFFACLMPMRDDNHDRGEDIMKKISNVFGVTVEQPKPTAKVTETENNKPQEQVNESTQSTAVQ